MSTPDTTTTDPVPDLSALNESQISGWHCARCGRRLYADKSIGVHDIDYGGRTVPYELWVCAPDCQTTKPPTGRRP